jgi:hypothetical protein
MGGVRKIRTEDGSGVLVAAGQLQVNDTTVTLTRHSSPGDVTDDISAYRLGAGRYQVNIKNFRGPAGFAIATVSAGSSQTGVVGGPGQALGLVPLAASVVAGSYSTNTYGFVIGIASGSTFTDSDCYFQAFAF